MRMRRATSILRCACVHIIGWLTNNFAGWHNMEVFAPPHRDSPRVYVLLLDWWVGWGPNRLFLVMVPSAYINLVCCCVSPRLRVNKYGRLRSQSPSSLRFFHSFPAVTDMFSSRGWPTWVFLHMAWERRYRCLTDWPVGLMIWASSRSFVRRG